MISPRLQRTLRYCAVLFLVIVPAYYFVYKLFWDDVSSGDALTTALIYGVLNVLFLGALHYFRVSNRVEEEEKE
jgi:hypothetical protein